jgi:hypothetical protein
LELPSFKSSREPKQNGRETCLMGEKKKKALSLYLFMSKREEKKPKIEKK